MEAKATIHNRLWIRWLPTQPSEPTDSVTLRVPSIPVEYFIDVRTLLGVDEVATAAIEKSEAEVLAISREQPGPKAADSLHAHQARGRDELAVSWDRLDWAFAGTCEQNGSQLVKTHWVDSKFINSDVQDVVELGPYRDPDSGEEKGDALQLAKGQMSNRKTGEVKKYEELWANIPIDAGGRNESNACVVLKTADDSRGQKGLVMRVGQCCQGILRHGSGIRDVTVERWVWNESDEVWKRIVRIGNGELPCRFLLEPSETQKGAELVVDRLVWRVEAVG